MGRHRGIRHVALRVTNLSRSRAFYTDLLDMRVVWEPDQDNAYFSSGSDNLALHQIEADQVPAYRSSPHQFLDHLGVILESREAVDALYSDMMARIEPLGGRIVNAPKAHRDGSYSFYCADPDGNVIQALYEPTIGKLT